MPIEIRELHIKAVIDTSGKKTGAGPVAGSDNEVSGTVAEQSPEQLIDLCVEKVLEILKDKQER
jgi:hypothetical protein